MAANTTHTHHKTALANPQGLFLFAIKAAVEQFLQIAHIADVIIGDDFADLGFAIHHK